MAAQARQPSPGPVGVWRWLALGQGVYFITTGVWPLLHIESFERVTGPKVDRWLVKTVGVLVTVIGGVLLLALRRREVTPEVVTLAAGSAGALAAIDVVYVARERIRPIYLADAAAELALVSAWLVDWLILRRQLGGE